MYGNVPPGQLGKPTGDLPTDTLEALIRIDADIQSVRRHLVFLEEKQDRQEGLTAEIIQLYKGATILGKLVAWIAGLAGSIGTMIVMFGDKK